ncbi:tetratricopeptide repeat protein [Actinoplanes solisilvae]|uniref:tetratricopeptide repeat protein n=1 Tax=Actinoplanes solisilvae TaxID=2486853 RepID=UPI000FDBA310|nr:tetratricopeptide repeat protein [Actinoplanes solisilvae]
MLKSWGERWRQGAGYDGLLQQTTTATRETAQLLQAGRGAEAARTGAEAVRLARRLAQLDEGRGREFLVKALALHAFGLGEAGRHDASATVAEEAVTLARELDPKVGPLADVLAVAAHRFLAVGRVDEALTMSREVIALTEHKPAAEIAAHLGTLAVTLAESGWPVEALAVSERSLSARRAAVAEQQPGSRFKYGNALASHANRLYAVGRWEEAAEHSAEAVDVLGEPGGAERAIRWEKLARALSNQSIFLAKVGRYDEADRAAEEAVTTSRKLAEVQPWQRPRLAFALQKYGVRLVTQDRMAEAREVCGEALQLYRELSAAEPAAFRGNLAKSVSDYAVVVADPAEALPFATEAVVLRQELVAGNRAVELPGLAMSLSNLARLQAALGRLDEALATGEDSLTTIREAAEANPAAHLCRYSSFLQQQAKRLDDADRTKEARVVGKKAIEAARRAVAEHRESNRLELADALEAQARRLNGNAAKAMVREARRLRSE